MQCTCTYEYLELHQRSCAHTCTYVHNVFSAEMLGSDIREKMSRSICEASLNDDAHCKMRSYMYTFIS